MRRTVQEIRKMRFDKAYEGCRDPLPLRHPPNGRVRLKPDARSVADRFPISEQLELRWQAGPRDRSK
jgi:hypothetical protein